MGRSFPFFVAPTERSLLGVRSAHSLDGQYSMWRRWEEGDCPGISESHAVLAVKAVRAALRAVLRESAAPSPDGCAAACHFLGRAISPAQKEEDPLMNRSSISLIAQFADGSERPATGEEIIAAARDYMSRRATGHAAR